MSRVEVRDGFTQAIVQDLPLNSSAVRIEILKEIAQSGVSIDFLKLAPTGLSFLVPADKATATNDALTALEVSYELHAPRSIVMVHAVNMRDEEGLIARIVSSAIGTGLTLEHLGDMHDRMLIVLESGDAQKLAAHLLAQLGGVAT